jgi:hypothetical protein
MSREQAGSLLARSVHESTFAISVIHDLGTTPVNGLVGPLARRP